ncbi:hypothetical protein M406DRAFT_101111, partial [Cryphonectria parasitica EP155]
MLYHRIQDPDSCVVCLGQAHCANPLQHCGQVVLKGDSNSYRVGRPVSIIPVLRQSGWTLCETDRSGCERARESQDMTGIITTKWHKQPAASPVLPYYLRYP